ncbi:hypothetical protein E2320_004538 [Naja naja]|nr:hypothetical protein E2320_004538 [Naja naja]
MAALLPFAPYNPASEMWDSYLARFDCFLEANDFAEITDNRKRALFLNFCSPEIFEMPRALLAEMAIQSGPWDMLQSKLQTHYVPKPSQIAHQHAFHHRNHAEGESMNKYIAALQKAALQSEFRDLDDALLDRVVCGVRDVKLQWCFFAKTDLTLQMVLDKAQAAEMSNQSMAEIQKSNSSPALWKPVTVHHEDANHDESADEDDDICCLKSSKGRNVATEKRQPTCAGCGGNHLQMACKFRNVICQRCEKKEHLARVCHTNQLTATTVSPETCPKRMQKIRQRHGEDCFISRGTCKAEAVIGQASLSYCKKIHVTILIEPSPCHMEVDTGFQ